MLFKWLRLARPHHALILVIKNKTWLSMVFIYVKENIKYNEVNCKYGSTFLYSCSLHCPLLYLVKVTSLNVSLHIIMNFIFLNNLLTPGFLDVLICLHIHNASYISVFLSGIKFSFILTESDWKPKRAGDVTSGLVSELATTLLKTQTEITYCSVLWKNKQSWNQTVFLRFTDEIFGKG